MYYFLFFRKYLAIKIPKPTRKPSAEKEVANLENSSPKMKRPTPIKNQIRKKLSIRGALIAIIIGNKNKEFTNDLPKKYINSLSSIPKFISTKLAAKNAITQNINFLMFFFIVDYFHPI